MEVLRLLQSTGADVALVGFDDSELATLLRPDLTVVAQDATTIGTTAIDMLRARIADQSLPATRITVPVELLTRGSGERPPR